MLQAKEISKTYHSGDIPCTALHPTSLQINDRDFAAVCGPSGSGKTTLLNLLGCIDSSDSGEILMNGKKLIGSKPNELARIRRENFGFIFQTYNLIPVLSVFENIALPLTLLGRQDDKKDRDAVFLMLEKVGLHGLENRRPLQLSGGQQQRVSIARALVKQPAIVFADEPTANLDTNTGEAIIDLMKEMNRENGTTFLFSTHDRMIMKHANRLIHIRDGAIIPEGGD